MSRKISLFALACLSLSAPAGATVIYVSGDQTGTWAADTVIVTAEVRVPPEQNLTILPGVEVLFSVYCKLIVDNATLQAVGTAADSIRFDVLPPNATWHGIRFLSASDSSLLEYCRMSHGYATGYGEESRGGAIYCSSSSPTIQHCFIYNCTASSAGGAIYCSGSSPTIQCCLIDDCTAWSYGGGGIYCSSSNPIVSGNTISGNVASAMYCDGGGICCFNSNPIISGNIISGNSASLRGGGTYCEASSPIISGNTIGGNSAPNGGGIYCYANSNPIISGNTISGNSAASSDGGGIDCYYYSSPIISGNTISGNSAVSSGGGICCGYYSSPTISHNTITGNTVMTNGGGLYCHDSSNPTLVNCILWGNRRRQIGGDTPQVTYSDIQGGYAGTGNINAWPAFVDTAQHDYRLQWDSPCIDTGDPNPLYNDPDLTRADMGAWYYDQSIPMRILLTPYNAPIQIPPEGGSFQYAIQATNIESATLSALIWCNVTLPSGTIYGPVLDPVTVSLAAGQTISHLRRQNISAHAPAGMYHYNAYAVAVGDTSEDSFTFTKLGAGCWDLGAGGWTNTGEDIVGGTPSVASSPSGSEATPTMEVMPNPFNPSTVLSCQLPVASHISLIIFDTVGRQVATLVNGWRDAGAHEVTFDGSGLPSGIYFAKLKAGDYVGVQKMVLLK